MTIKIGSITAIDCGGDALHVRGNIDLEVGPVRALRIGGRAVNISVGSNEPEPQRNSEPKKKNKLHQSPAGIMSLNIASMLSGTAIGRAIGLL